ncbi:MAG: response regulator [Desulfobacterales bacterium]|jgi:anti-anti-sigma factor|nr:response regulator [Desulfobacterales bacterium]MCU0584574.1 response regulator [Desulfobacterales bacterium]
MEKILVIDDEKPTLMMFRLTLSAYGYEVLTAENGQEGLELFGRERPRIVLTDIKMPGMNGIEVLQQIKAIDPATEVIVITGHGDMDLAIQALNLDATDFINKPIQRHLLEAAIRRAQDRRRLAGEQAAELGLQTTEQAAVIVIQGSITAAAEARLQALYREAAALDKSRIVLHFLESATVNGAGIGVLTQLLLESRSQGRHVVVAELSENLRKVFEIVGLSKIAPMVDSLEKALA